MKVAARVRFHLFAPRQPIKSGPYNNNKASAVAVVFFATLAVDFPASDFSRAVLYAPGACGRVLFLLFVIRSRCGDSS